MSEILDFQAGREARMEGKLRDKRRNQHWLLGWDMMQRDIEAHEAMQRPLADDAPDAFDRWIEPFIAEEDQDD